MKESYLYQKLSKNQVQCQTCAHQCKIALGQRGICGVRENQNGTLMVLNYGRAIAAHIDPIEKKPLYHFLPGTFTYSIAAAGCNFRCQNCQNWEISQAPKDTKLTGEEISKMGWELKPEEIIKQTLKHNCPSISYTYTEPTIFLEWALDTMKLAKTKGLKNIWVSNGFMSAPTIELIAPYLDAANIDLKSFDDNFYKKICGSRLEPVLENLKTLKKLGIHLEITTLVIPTLSDDEKMFAQIAQFIKTELSPETPWHISRFSPAISWQLKNLPSTPLAPLKKAQQIGLSVGLKNVYLGNV
jgi:pyruvate formate lyase activating enzyme